MIVKEVFGIVKIIWGCVIRSEAKAPFFKAGIWGAGERGGSAPLPLLLCFED